MEWSAYVDVYCERTAPGLFNEPLNAISNLAFIAVALWAARQAARQKADAATWLLIVVVGLIGLGSLAFHTFATRLSALADVIPIAVFIYGFLIYALRRFFKASWWAALAAAATLLIINIASERLLPPGLLNGSVAYVPALAFALITAIAARTLGLAVQAQLTAAAVVLSVSLIFRTLDQAACGLLPFGTHFVWHLLNAAVLGFYLEAALRHGAPKGLPHKN